MTDEATPEVEELSTSTCWALLREVDVGRIALHGSDDEIEQHDDVIAAFALRIRTWHVGHKHAYVRLVPDVVTGRRFLVDPTNKEVHR